MIRLWLSRWRTYAQVEIQSPKRVRQGVFKLQLDLLLQIQHTSSALIVHLPVAPVLEISCGIRHFSYNEPMRKARGDKRVAWPTYLHDMTVHRLLYNWGGGYAAVEDVRRTGTQPDDIAHNVVNRPTRRPRTFILSAYSRLRCSLSVW